VTKRGYLTREFKSKSEDNQGERLTSPYVRLLAEKVAYFDEEVINFVMPHKRYALGEALQGVSQGEIALVLNMSQPSVCYLINSTIKRCSYRQSVPRPSEYDIETGINDLNPSDRKVLVEMFHAHANQNQVARKLNRSQGYVRYRFLKSLPSVQGPLRAWFELAKAIEPKWEVDIDYYKGKTPKHCPDGGTLRKLAMSALDKNPIPLKGEAKDPSPWIPFPWQSWKPF
jgi:hypothetical protein